MRNRSGCSTHFTRRSDGAGRHFAPRQKLRRAKPEAMAMGCCTGNTKPDGYAAPVCSRKAIRPGGAAGVGTTLRVVVAERHKPANRGTECQRCCVLRPACRRRLPRLHQKHASHASLGKSPSRVQQCEYGSKPNSIGKVVRVRRKQRNRERL